MITQVNCIGAGVIKDPRRKAQSVQFRNSSTIPYKSGYNEQYEKQRNNALWTSLSIVAGSILFALGYFVLTSLGQSTKNAKHAV